MSHFCDVENREAKEVAQGVKVRTFWADQMLVSIVDLDAHVEVPSHSHPHEQAGTVMTGHFELEIDGEARRLGPGDTYLIPGGVMHAARTAEHAARVLDVFSPVREEWQY